MKTVKFYNELEEYLFEYLTEQTGKSYLHLIKRFLRQFPGADNFSLKEIEAYFYDLKTKGNKVNYRKVILAALKVYYDFLLYRKMIPFHPCKSFYITEKRPSGINFGGLLSMEEMELLFTLKENRYKYLLNRDKVIIGLLIYQGVTSGELANIRVQDIKDGTVFIRGNRNRLSRTIELKSSQMEPMLNYMNEERENLMKVQTDRLILTMRGVPITVDSIHAFINGMAGAFEREMSPANIRKSVISYWINERGFKLEDVQIMAGHKYPSSTQKYVRANTDEQRDVMTKLHESIFM